MDQGHASAVTDSKATEVIIALRYWTRATGYQPTSEEQAVLRACDDKATNLWRAGIGIGGSGGLTLSTYLKMPVIQRLAIGSAFASMGSFYGSFKANKHCLDGILDLGKPGSEFDPSSTSRLANQAHQILKDGGAMTVRSLTEAQAARRHQNDNSAQHRGTVQHGPGMPEAQRLQNHVATIATPSETRTESPTEQPASPNFDTVPLVSGDSWEAVRQRYRARQMGESPGMASPPLAPPPAAPISRGAAQTTETRGRVRRNAYGDEVVAE